MTDQPSTEREEVEAVLTKFGEANETAAQAGEELARTVRELGDAR